MNEREFFNWIAALDIPSNYDRYSLREHAIENASETGTTDYEMAKATVNLYLDQLDMALDIGIAE